MSIVLMQWGLVQFDVVGLNYHELDHQTKTDWARKEIAGAPIHREWVGEDDEEVYIRGSVFPFRLGGMGALDYMNEQRWRGAINKLVRGDGVVNMGWFAIEKLTRGHKFIDASGQGQRIDFEAIFVRMPVPDAESYFAQLVPRQTG